MKEEAADTRIHSLGYDPEADELDLLIDAEAPVPAESVPVGEGIYVQCEPSSGCVVGAFIRGYSHLLKKICVGGYVSDEEAERRGLREVFQAILQWVRDHAATESPFRKELKGGKRR